MKSFLFAASILASYLLARAQEPIGVAGTVKTHEAFESKFVQSRRVDVWLPPGYEKDSARRFGVLYMHDGQNLFDPKLSFIGVDWGVDEALSKLINEGKVSETIVVGVWNTPKRVQEYLPAKMVLAASLERRQKLNEDLGRMGLKVADSEWKADEYLKFLVAELKPFVDSTYRTKPGAEHTSIMGSSAGGLISLYAICEYPEVFSRAGCVSIHWPVGDGLMLDYAKSRLPDPKLHRLYFDFGTETLDKGYEPYQLKMDAILKEAGGWESNKNWLTRKFEGADHSERSWRKRVAIPLEFLLR